MEPAEIRKLDEAVVNRIAAGEIIQRPANALKELIENSMDAKSTFIQITVKAGGLKMLQIQDNGTGIRKDNLDIVCERFTTSKLSKFEDLSNIATFGFRGEALASISHVAHLTIQTKTAQEICAYKASYADGKLKAAPKPCAGNQGTIITIEELFWNMPQRKNALRSPADEFQKISDIVFKYAIHNAHVGFSLKKFGEQQLTMKTAIGATKEQNIQHIYGAQIAKELLSVQLADDTYKFRMEALITKVNYAAKKGIMLLFINQRLVESIALKTAIDNVYSLYLAKGTHPFIYISLQLLPMNVDVNVHPTKHAVHFLHEDEIVEKIKCHIEEQLLGSNSTRTFYKQLKLPGVKDDEQAANETISSTQESKLQPKNLVRTDSKEQKLEKFLITANNSKKLLNTSSQETTNNNNSNESYSQVAKRKAREEVRLTSVLNMRKQVEQRCSVLLRKTLKDMVFVGVVDSTYALFQYETKLYMCNTQKFSEEFFYQRLVFEFQNFLGIKLEPKLSVKKLIMIALQSEDSGWTEEDGDKEELAERATKILQEKAMIMRSYFSVSITHNGELETLPQLLHEHLPCSTFLPLYLLRLATEVEWESEEECFETFCRETAQFYALHSAAEWQMQAQKQRWQIEHVLYPAFKRYLLPPSTLKNQLYELTNLPALYKVFERC